MRPWNSSNHRWQFSLGALFGALTVAAFIAAAVAGSFGAPVRESVVKLATMLLVVGAGLVYYVLFVLVLCSPIMLAVGCLKLAAWVIARQRDDTPDDQTPQSPEFRDL